MIKIHFFINLYLAIVQNIGLLLEKIQTLYIQILKESFKDGTNNF
jgi:hypothetical protein